jgi:hypothetical protein
MKLATLGIPRDFFLINIKYCMVKKLGNLAFKNCKFSLKTQNDTETRDGFLSGSNNMFPLFPMCSPKILPLPLAQAKNSDKQF